MDKVADLLIRIKNGYLARAAEIEAPYSKLNLGISTLLAKEGFVGKVEVKEKRLKVALRYHQNQPALIDIKRVSKPGRRVYSKSKLLPKVLNGLGIAIVSTPKGIMSDKQARKQALGGEVMAYVW